MTELKNAIRSIQANNIKPVYYLKGDDHFLQNFFIEKLCNSIFIEEKINKNFLTPNEMPGKEIIDNILFSDLFNSKKLFILVDPQKVKGRPLKDLLNYCSNPDSNHVLVLINGIPINDQSTTQGLHDFGLDFIQTIQQIEVYPGSSATHFGTNAIGGAINIILSPDFKDSFSVLSDKDKNYELSGNKTFLFNNSLLNIKVGSVKNETISARGNSNDENDGVKNYSTNINFENYINDSTKIYSNNYR